MTLRELIGGGALELEDAFMVIRSVFQRSAETDCPNLRTVLGCSLSLICVEPICCQVPFLLQTIFLQVRPIPLPHPRWKTVSTLNGTSQLHTLRVLPLLLLLTKQTVFG
jgi:hypothetical protein